MFVLFSVACARMPLTPITPVPTGQYHPGRVVWHDLLTDDVDSAANFYGRLFGWTFQERDRYTIVLNDGIPIAGIVQDRTGTERSARGRWIVYLSTENLEESARWVDEAGGRVIKGPAEMINRGHYAMIRDPQGAPLVLLRSFTGDPDPAEATLGGWLWNELWTTNTEAALAFYQPLGGYAARQAGSGDTDGYWVLMSNGAWQAGMTVVPFEDVPAQWVPVIRVSDPIAVAARVPSLGGRVLVKPDHPLSEGSISVIEDPSGAIFMVESWQP